MRQFRSAATVALTLLLPLFLFPSPAYAQLATGEVWGRVADMAGHAIVLKVDTERHPDLAARYNVRGIPELCHFYNNQLVMQQAGVVNHSVMESWLKSAASAA